MLKKHKVIIGIVLILAISTIVCIVEESKKEAQFSFVNIFGGRRIMVDKTGPNRLLFESGRKVRLYGFTVSEDQLSSEIKNELTPPKWVKQERSNLYINSETDEAVRLIRLTDLKESDNFESIAMISRRPPWIERLMDLVFP